MIGARTTMGEWVSQNAEGTIEVAARTVLSADPVASTNSLKGLKPRQLTSASCAITA